MCACAGFENDLCPLQNLYSTQGVILKSDKFDEGLTEPRMRHQGYFSANHLLCCILNDSKWADEMGQ